MGEMIEVARSAVQTWECDQMGHMNVQFYVAKAEEGMTALAAALGLSPRAQRSDLAARNIVVSGVGLAIGLVKALGGQYLPDGTAYDYVWIFVVLIVVLVFRPQGFFGETERVRA